MSHLKKEAGNVPFKKKRPGMSHLKKSGRVGTLKKVPFILIRLGA